MYSGSNQEDLHPISKIPSGEYEILVSQTTTEHTITLRALTCGFLFWDYVVFKPVD